MKQRLENSLLDAKNSKSKYSAIESLVDRIERILSMAFVATAGVAIVLVLPYFLYILIIYGDRGISKVDTFWPYLLIFIHWLCVAGLFILNCIRALFLKRKV